MTWFSNLPIRVKLLGSFSLAIALMAIATIFALRSASSAAGATSDLYNVQFKGQMTLDEAKQAFLMSNISTMDALLAEDPGEAAEVVAEAEVHQTQARATLADYAATQADPEIRSVIEEALAATADEGAGEVAATLVRRHKGARLRPALVGKLPE